MRIDASGNVGIGTTSPSTKLHLGGTAPLDSIIRQDSTTSGTNWEIGEREAGKWQIFEDDGDSIVATFMSSGNVGIGTSSPDTKLHVHKGSAGSVTALSDSSLVIENSTHNYLTFLSPNNVENAIIFGDADSNNQGGLSYHHSTNHMGFNTAGSERMRIDSSGSLGLGTSNPSAKCHLYTSTSNAINLGIQNSQRYWKIENANEKLSIADVNAGGLARMTFDTAGRVGIGISSPNYKLTIQNTTTETCLELINQATSGNHRIVDFVDGAGSLCGNISIDTSANTVSFNTSSDYRLKENVDYDFTALDRVAQLKPARFNFISDANTTVDGFLAHEVQDIVPEAIFGEKDAVDDEGNPEYQGIDQSKLVPLLTKAIQEQQAIIDDLKSRIETLEG